MENLQGYSDSEDREIADQSDSSVDRSSGSSDKSDEERGGDQEKPAENCSRSGAGPSGGSKSGLMSAADLFAVQVDTVYVRPPSKEYQVKPTESAADKKGTIFMPSTAPP